MVCAGVSVGAHVYTACRRRIPPVCCSLITNGSKQFACRPAILHADSRCPDALRCTVPSQGLLVAAECLLHYREAVRTISTFFLRSVCNICTLFPV